VAPEPDRQPVLEWLTPEQEQLLRVVREAWLRVGLSTQPADRAGAERGVRLAYQAAGLEAPRTVIWLPSPLAGVIASVLLEPGGQDLWEPVRAHLRAHVDERVWERVRAQVHAQAGEQVWAQAGGRPSWEVWDELWAVVFDPIDDVWTDHVAEQLEFHVYDETWSAVRGEVHEPVWRQVAAQLEERLQIQWSGLVGLHGALEWEVGEDSWGGQFDAGWLSYLDYITRAAPELASSEPLQGVMLVARSAGPWWPFDNVVVLTERPSALHRDQQGRLHHPQGPALAYPDGWGVWAWHGARVPRDVIERPEAISVQRIRNEPNTARRRVLLERYGHHRYLRDAGAERLHTDQTGTLWRCELRDDEPLVMVEVRNSTPEPDGTRASYWLRVPPTVRTAQEAVAWTFGLDQGEYQPTAQT